MLYLFNSWRKIVFGQFLHGLRISNESFPIFLDKWISQTRFDTVNKKFFNFLDNLHKQTFSEFFIFLQKSNQMGNKMSRHMNRSRISLVIRIYRIGKEVEMKNGEEFFNIIVFEKVVICIYKEVRMRMR